MAFGGVRGKCYCFVLCVLATVRETAGFQLANFRVAGFRQARNAGLIHVSLDNRLNGADRQVSLSRTSFERTRLQTAAHSRPKTSSFLFLSLDKAYSQFCLSDFAIVWFAHVGQLNSGKL